MSVIFIFIFKITNCDLKRIVVILRTKVVLLAYKPLSHNPFLWKERKINSFIALIVLLVIASHVVRYLPLYHSTLPHPEWTTPCGVNLLLPYIRLSSVLPFLQSLPCARVFHLSLYTASFLIAIYQQKGRSKTSPLFAFCCTSQSNTRLNRLTASIFFSRATFA